MHTGLDFPAPSPYLRPSPWLLVVSLGVQIKMSRDDAADVVLRAIQIASRKR